MTRPRTGSTLAPSKAGIEARGFIFGTAAYELGVGFAPLRKADKVPCHASGQVVEACFVIDLPDLGGADDLRTLGCESFALCAFEGD